MKSVPSALADGSTSQDYYGPSSGVFIPSANADGTDFMTDFPAFHYIYKNR
jgi:hypothetical protein